MRVSSTARKFERIKTHQHNFYTRIQRNMQCHTRAPQNRSRSRNEVIRIRFRHLIVNSSQTQYGHSITEQPHSHITGQNMLQIPGAPYRSALGLTLVLSPSWLSTRQSSHRRA
ncbi:hypothetical protein M9H77_30568 [Catharanthus roseus]|uniref:Uncharacterized protein n=1 Tax=Catharanthus roseus TaxID=4058 RepID=A0ACB9ZY02_CATRO|nr:hypothetical protein M9H77_30568 [Catharanthus roseus]